MQRGRGHVEGSAAGQRITVTLPQKYTNTNYLVIVSDNVPFDDNGEVAKQSVGALNTSVNTFTVAASGSNIYFAWEAKGYIR